MKSVQSRRHAKFDGKLIANRHASGEGISLRIADRLIALQEFSASNVAIKNSYCGSLNGIHRDIWPSSVIEYFEIDTEKLASGQKEKTLEYLIGQLEKKNVRVSRGVLSNKLLPMANDIRTTYRKSSGFALKDDAVPFIFLPNELSDSETHGRQILTLLSILVLIGLDEYNMYITGQLELSHRTNKTLSQAFGVAGEILLPFSETDKLQDQDITETIRNNLAAKFMLTPSAVTVVLQQRGLIKNSDEYEKLLETRKTADPGSIHRRNPKIDNAVKKFCGQATNTDIITGIKTGTLDSSRAQYLIFGRIDKLRFEQYKANLGI